MKRFCDELRSERERRHVSIETICEVTKVSSRHVLALEAGDYSQLPGGVIRKGILRSYLTVLALDEAAWIERFEASLQASGEETPNEDAWAEFAENVRRNRGGVDSRSNLRWMGFGMMLAVLVALGWGLWRLVLNQRFF